MSDPYSLFTTWFTQAQALDVREPTAMALATASATGIPSVRIVLLKHYDDRGFCFYTNLTSRKGKELTENSHASLCFYWDALGQQVRIEGIVERVTEKEADDYFASRDRGSQIGAWASKQSCPLEQEEDLPKRVRQITEQFEAESPIPRPPFWSGFRLKPSKIEFWQNEAYRLHRRTLFTKTTTGWESTLLYP